MNPTPMGGDPGAPQDTTRLVITALLLVTMYGVWSFFLAPKPALPPEGQPGETPTETTPQGGTEPAAKPAEATAPEREPTAHETPAQPEQRVSVQAEVAGTAGQAVKTIEGGYVAVLSNQGAQIESFRLTGYDNTAEIDEETGEAPPYDLVAGGEVFALSSRGGEVQLKSRDPYTVVAADDRKVVFRRITAENVRISRTYTFDEGRFGFSHDVTVTNEGQETRVVELDLAMSSTYKPPGGGMFSPGPAGDVATCRTDTEQDGYDVSGLKDDGPITHSGQVQYVASSDHYFLSAILPDDPASTAACKLAYYDPKQKDAKSEQDLDGVISHLELASVTLKPGESKSFSQRAYFGPKQLQLLEQEGRSLDETIEFGIFGILSKPILWTLVKLYEGTGNFGWAIILLTLLIKLLTFPLTQKSYVSMQQMKTLGPELKKLQEKYAADRATLGQKQMELYKEKGINPLAGCFPILVQMPIWFALYRTLWTSVELYQKPYLAWITDLSRPDVFPGLGFAVLPFLVGALMLAQTAMQPPPQDQPQMKYVLWAMPIMFTVFMFGMPSGLSIYMITNSVLTFAQQLYIKKKYAVPEPEKA